VLVSLRGGAESLRRILDNLLVNACEGDGAGAARAVVLSVTPVGSTVEIAVRDDGPGFRPELLASPPRPFATTKPGGTGLGLYTAARLVAASGGSLRRENAPGGGAVVTLRLPAAAARGVAA
jgi:C4-dicarboxylate-specific signal transduction histidine kinase